MKHRNVNWKLALEWQMILPPESRDLKLIERIERMINLKYKCMTCGEIHTKAEWNTTTKDVFDTDFSGSIEPITYRVSKDNNFFACPSCRTEQRDSNIKRISKKDQ